MSGGTMEGCVGAVVGRVRAELWVVGHRLVGLCRVDGRWWVGRGLVRVLALVALVRPCAQRVGGIS